METSPFGFDITKRNCEYYSHRADAPTAKDNMAGLIQLVRRLLRTEKNVDNSEKYPVSDYRQEPGTPHVSKSYFEADNLDDLLSEVYTELLKEESELKATRGNFVEFSGCILVLNNPRARLSRSESRGKIFSGLAELLWYLSGENRLDFMEYYLPGVYADESEDQQTVRSAYGERLLASNGINQLRNIIDLLTKKPTSRRAVIQLFDASDLTEDFISVPCTCTLQFIGRDNKLNMLVNMRSNDAYKGLPHDIFSFTMLQEIIARSVGLDVGTYKHCVGSLHLYTHVDKKGKSDKERVQAYLNEGYFISNPMPAMPAVDPWPAIKQLQDFEKQARAEENILAYDHCGSDYWNDLCRLFAFFHHYRQAKSGSTDFLEKCNEIKTQMSSKVFDIFLVTKIDNIDNSYKNDSQSSPSVLTN